MANLGEINRRKSIVFNGWPGINSAVSMAAWRIRGVSASNLAAYSGEWRIA